MPKQPWSPADKERLRRLHEETGEGPTALAAQFPDRSVDSVRGQYESLGLGKTRVSEPVELGAEHRRIFTQMLRTHAATMIPADLLRHWNEHIAPQVSAPHLGRGTIDYWLTKLKLRQPDGQAKAAKSVRRRKVISRRLRLRGQRDAIRRRKELERRRAALRAADAAILCHECPRCREEWPKSSEFFKEQKTRGGGTRLDLASCRLCRNQRRRVRSQNEADGVGNRDLTIERRAAARADLALEEQEARSAALARATAVLERDLNAPARECVRCEGRFPLDAEYFARHTGGNKQLKHLCLFCDRAMARQLRNAKADRDRRLLGILAKERRVLTRKGRAQEMRERRKLMTEQAREVKEGPKLQCPKCFQLWPKTEVYWTIHRYRTKSGPSECLRVSMCRCCWNEACTERKRRNAAGSGTDESEQDEA